MDDPNVLRAMREGGPLVNGRWPTEQKPEEPLICPRTEKEIDEDDLYACDFCGRSFCKDCMSLDIHDSDLDACCECMENQQKLVQEAVLSALSMRAKRTGSSADLKHYMAVRREYKEGEQ